MYWDTGELGHWNLGEAYVEVFIWDGKDLEVGMLADSLCDEALGGHWRTVPLRTRTEPLRVSPSKLHTTMNQTLNSM